MMLSPYAVRVLPVQYFEYSLAARRWQRFDVPRDTLSQAVGHTAVFHAATRAIIVYGGVRPYHARYGESTGDLYAFNVDTRFWIKVSMYLYPSV